MTYMVFSVGERYGAWGSSRAWQAGGGLAGAKQLNEPHQEYVFALLKENCSHSVLNVFIFAGSCLCD